MIIGTTTPAFNTLFRDVLVEGMGNKFLIITGILLGVLVVVFGIRAVSDRTAQSEIALQKSPVLNSHPTPSDRQLQAALGMVERAPS